MDAKNRVTVPSDWLGKEGDVFFVLPAKTNLNVMPAEELARQEDHLRAQLSPGPILQEALRHVYSSARKVEADKQGRILLPDELCKKFELKGEVAFVGVKSRFEIWNSAARSSADGEKPGLSEEARLALEAVGF